MREEEQPMALEDLGLEVRILSNLIYNRLNQTTVEVENLTIHQYWILSYLTANLDKEVYQKEIEQLFSIKRSTTNEMLRTMETRGFIRRTVSSEDARRNILSVTEEGIAAREQLDQDLSRLMLQFFGDIPRSELEQFQCTLQTLRHNIE